MTIYFLRHGPAEDFCGPGDTDGARALTPEGKEEVRRVAGAFPRLGVRPDIILTSPLVRARQTAGIVARTLGLAENRVLETGHLSPGADHALLVRQLRQASFGHGGILLVGHEPDLSHFAALLLTGSPESLFAFKKTGLARIDCDTLAAARCGRLRWLLQPQHMASL
jgi:phosphohistidine phosphatase